MAKKRKQRVVLDHNQRAEVALKLDKGISATELAKVYGVAVSTIGKIGKRHNGPVRERAPASHATQGRLADQDS